jgi:hypothetical protein
MNENLLTEEQKLAMKKLENSAQRRGMLLGLKTMGMLLGTGLAVVLIAASLELPEGFLKLGGFCSGVFVGYYMYTKVIEEDKRVADELARILALKVDK